MGIIITYDVPSKHNELKEALFKQGYSETITYKDRNTSHSKTAYLPNTTLFHTSKTAESAVKDIENVCSNLNIKLERCIATQLGPDAFVLGGVPFGK